MLGFKALLQFLLTEHCVLPPQGLLKAWLGLQRLLIAQHRVVVLPKHLEPPGRGVGVHTEGELATENSSSCPILGGNSFITIYHTKKIMNHENAR